jgi:chromosome segregation ATPase
MFWKRKSDASKSTPRSSGDRELDSLHAELAQRQEQVAALELELFEVNRFVEDLDLRFGPLQRRLDELKLDLEDARNRASRRARWGSRADSDDLPEMRDRFEENRKKDARAKFASPPPPPPPEPPSEAQEAEIKTLYRALAKRFHPDLATDPAEKEWRAGMMARVNAAYEARDLNALHALAHEPDRPPPPPAPKTREQVVAELRAEVARLDGVIADLERRLDQLAETPAVQLKLDAKLARQSGRDLLAEMEAELRAEIAKAEEELAALMR